jgi:FtsZ-interacting cell division protein YlmF
MTEVRFKELYSADAIQKATGYWFHAYSIVERTIRKFITSKPENGFHISHKGDGIRVGKLRRLKGGKGRGEGIYVIAKTDYDVEENIDLLIKADYDKEGAGWTWVVHRDAPVRGEPFIVEYDKEDKEVKNWYSQERSEWMDYTIGMYAKRIVDFEEGRVEVDTGGYSKKKWLDAEKEYVKAMIVGFKSGSNGDVLRMGNKWWYALQGDGSDKKWNMSFAQLEQVRLDALGEKDEEEEEHQEEEEEEDEEPPKAQGEPAQQLYKAPEPQPLPKPVKGATWEEVKKYYENQTDKKYNGNRLQYAVALWSKLHPNKTEREVAKDTGVSQPSAHRWKTKFSE